MAFSVPGSALSRGSNASLARGWTPKKFSVSMAVPLAALTCRCQDSDAESMLARARTGGARPLGGGSLKISVPEGASSTFTPIAWKGPMTGLDVPPPDEALYTSYCVPFQRWKLSSTPTRTTSVSHESGRLNGLTMKCEPAK